VAGIFSSANLMEYNNGHHQPNPLFPFAWWILLDFRSDIWRIVKVGKTQKRLTSIELKN